jgi:hypothetical protein
LGKKPTSKSIGNKERPAEFTRISDLVFKEAKINYNPSSAVDYEIYRRALKRFGLLNDFFMFQYPETISRFDLRTEEGITSLMKEIANEYIEIDEGITADPQSMRDVLWPLFRVDYNPKFAPFADAQLAEIKMTIDEIDEIIATENNDASESVEAAKGTSLEGTVGNPVSVAESIRTTINLRYIQSFGYKLSGFSEKISESALFDYVQLNLGDDAPFKLSKEEQKAREAEELRKFSEKSKSSSSAVNSGSSSTSATPASTSSSVNSEKTTPSSENKTGATSPINSTTAKTAEGTSVTGSEGGVTSKTGELQTENILNTTPSQAINVNLENKPTESKPAASASSTTNTSNTSNSTTVNDAKSTSTETSSPSNTASNVSTTGDKNIMKVENTNNQSSSSTVNESKPEKEKGGFLSKVGNFAKKAGAALNLPSVGELGEQAKGLFGATGANISSRISEVKNSFAINSNKEESNSSPTSSTATNSVNSSNTTANTKPNDILAVPNTGTTSNTSDILKTETQTAMNVEQNKPAVAATQSPVTNQTTQSTNPAASAVSNTSNSQNTSSPTTTTSNVSQNTQSAVQQPGSPAGGGVNVDTNQLAQSITRLERILISGIEVTIKDA